MMKNNEERVIVMTSEEFDSWAETRDYIMAFCEDDDVLEECMAIDERIVIDDLD